MIIKLKSVDFGTTFTIVEVESICESDDNEYTVKYLNGVKTVIKHVTIIEVLKYE